MSQGWDCRHKEVDPGGDKMKVTVGYISLKEQSTSR